MKRDLLRLEIVGNWYKLTFLEKEYYSNNLQQCLEKLMKEIEKLMRI